MTSVDLNTMTTRLRVGSAKQEKQNRNGALNHSCMVRSRIKYIQGSTQYYVVGDSICIYKRRHSRALFQLNGHSLLQTSDHFPSLWPISKICATIVFQTFVVVWPGNLELHLAHQHMVTGPKLPETTHHSGMQLHVIWSVSCNQEGRHLLQADRTKLKEEPQVYKANKWWMPLRNAKVSAPIWYQCKMAIRLFPE